MNEETRGELLEAMRRCDFIEERVNDGVSTGYLDIKPVEDFIDQAIQAERERIVEEIKTLNSGKGGGSPESFDSGFIEAQKNVINLIQNK